MSDSALAESTTQTLPASVAPPEVTHSDLLTGLFREACTRAAIPNSPESLPVAAEPADPAAGHTPLPQAWESAQLSPPPVHSGFGVESLPSNGIGTPGLPVSFASFDSESLKSSHEPATGASVFSVPYSQGVSDVPDYYFLGAPIQPSALAHTASRGIQPPVPSFDIEGLRGDFPALRQRMNGHPLVYLDNAATTQKPQAVIDATSGFYSRDNAPVHRAAYDLAERTTAAFEGAREKVREFLGAKDKKEIVFTRGTTEAINLVAQTFGRKFIGQGDEILLTELEHHANIVPWQILAGQTGAVIKVVPINDRGELILEEFVTLLGPKTKLVSVSHVSNALGTINPVEQIIQLAHAKGAHVLIDGAQSTPHLPVNVQALDADFFVFSGHKVFGPTGIGALYGKACLLEALPPWQGGGHMIKDVRFENTVYQNAPEKFEAGTPDIAGAIGLGAAIDYLFKIGIPAIAAYEHSLLEYATHLLQSVPGLRLIGTAASKASVLSFILDGCSNEKIASHLDRKGIAVRAGHHCALPSQRHFGIESTVRPSLAFYNTRADIDSLVQALNSLIRR